jgi:hypothetical protein
VASACLAAGLTTTMLAAFLLPGAARLRPTAPAPASGATVVYAWTLDPARALPPTAGRSDQVGADTEGRPAARVRQPQWRERPERSERSERSGPADPAPPAPAARVLEAAVAPPEAAPAAAALTPGPSTNTTVTAPAPARAASTPPLRLDRSVVREASRASRSTVQQMAEASGQPAGDGPVSAEQRLANSVARTVKPDCLPPGGTHGLLTPIVAAYKIATDTCRNR